MQVTKEQIDPCKVALTVTVPAETVKAAKTKAFAQASRNIQIPGFRKGKVPPHMARPYVDDARVRQQAAEAVVGPCYADALQETETEPFGNLAPDLELVDYPETGPLVFKAFVPLRPIITLGLYKGLGVERRILEVTDADIDRQIEEIQSRHAEYPEVTDRTSQTGDIVLADLQAEIEGQETPELAEPKATVIEIGKNIPDFDEGLVGLTVGESKTIEAIYPDTFPDEKLRGKRATFHVTIKELRAKNLPELFDEFVQKVHPTAKTEAEFREAIRESLHQAAGEMADSELEMNLVSKIVDGSQIAFPDALLRAEVEDAIRQLQEQLQAENLTVEQYLENTGQTGEQVQNEMNGQADRRIRNSLILSEIARTEEITLEDEDVDRQITLRAERARVSPAAVRAFAEKNDQMNQFRDQALTEKILTFLKGASTVTERTVTGDELREMEAAASAQVSETATQADAETEETAEPAAPLAVQSAAPTGRRKKAAAPAGTDEAEVATAETPAEPAEGAGPDAEAAEAAITETA